MGDAAPPVHTAITITAAVLLILKAKVNPALALLLSAIYLGIVCGIGPNTPWSSSTRASVP